GRHEWIPTASQSPSGVLPLRSLGLNQFAGSDLAIGSTSACQRRAQCSSTTATSRLLQYTCLPPGAVNVAVGYSSRTSHPLKRRAVTVPSFGFQGSLMAPGSPWLLTTQPAWWK